MTLLPAQTHICVEQLAFAYGKSSLFSKFDAQVAHPGVYGLFGRNGSGKSTLLKLLAGLLTPQAGRVQVLGYTPRQRAAEFLEQIYILPEEFHLPNLTPQTLARTHAAFYPRFDNALFNEYLSLFEVAERQGFASMSLGQKKKAAIAFALATQTPVLLMDEPTNGLDIVSRAQFKLLMARPEQAARIMLISTHQAHDLESILSDIWFIDGGKLVLCATMVDLSTHLRMGVAADATQLPGADHLVYQEPVGQQAAWVARRATGEAPGVVQLELLYKALSFNKDAVLAALPPVAALAHGTQP